MHFKLSLLIATPHLNGTQRFMKSGFPNSQFCSFLYGTQSSKIKLSFLALKIENEKKIYTKSCAAMNMHNSPIIDALS